MEVEEKIIQERYEAVCNYGAPAEWGDDGVPLDSEDVHRYLAFKEGWEDGFNYAKSLTFAEKLKLLFSKPAKPDPLAGYNLPNMSHAAIENLKKRQEAA